ncbi:class I SAM-dependent RNA methyltransferase [soil metagenome]
MPLTTGETIELVIEKPAGGGRMIARHEGQIVLVLGAIPGERVRAHVDRADKRLAFASTVAVLDPSADRREPGFDPRCGGCAYAHVAYERQLALKAEVIADAFERIGRIPLPDRVAIASSRGDGYRMRARLHVHQGRPGFYREGSHRLCDAGPTRQLLPETIEAVERVVREVEAAGHEPIAVDVSENVAADQRAMLVELTGSGYLLAGDPSVADSLGTLTEERAQGGELRRRPVSFFQGNRFLIGRLVTTVLDAIPPDGEVLDLYAGVGLFAVALAGTGRSGVTAVEADRAAGGDLEANATAFPGALAPVVMPVEEYLARRRVDPSATILVDPPRTGISRVALEGIAAQDAARIVYVSCDPATLARDARRLLDAGYRLQSLEGFDLFPNTPHVESVGVFDRVTRRPDVQAVPGS